ncbi:MAG TPA: polysaccharide deacetylase family protein [Polyangia bacterium]|nr:polysaccharide deacetylase family protein [Polyangia bacterium]
MSLGAAKRAVKQTFAAPLGWRLLGPLVRPPGVVVLMYHRIVDRDRSLVGLPIEIFAAQMRWVRDNCDPIEPEAIGERVRDGRRGKPAVLVTFDDGYRDYHDLAYPVLEKLGIPAVVFLATSFMDEGGMMWTDEVQWAALSTQRARVKLPWAAADGEIALPDAAARAALGAKARGHLKKLPDEERRAAVKALVAELGAPPARDRLMLTWDEVRATSGLTRFGGHSHTHPILSRLERAAAEREIRTCRDRIAAETGKTPTTFAYPNGQPADYTGETQEILRAHGFTTVYATTEGIAGADTDWMAIRRLAGDTEDLAQFAWLATGRSG